MTKPTVTIESLRELQDAFIEADKKVRRGPLKGKLVLKPHFSIQINGYSFPAWTGELGKGVPLSPGDIASRYKGSSPAESDMGDPEKEGHWIITGPIQYVIEWYSAWLALLAGELQMKKGGPA